MSQTPFILRGVDMHKDKFDKYEKRLQAKANADKSEYQRLVTDNKELHDDLIALRVKHGLPFRDNRDYSEWLRRQALEAFEIAERENIVGNLSLPKVDELKADVDALAKKYKATKWREAINSLAIFGRVGWVSFSMGLAGGAEFIYNDDGTYEIKVVIPPDFDATNPIAVESLTLMRKQFEKPPQPRPMKDDPTKTDWRPVWEWHHRHPDVTDKEIAQALGVNRVTVTRRFNELDAEYNEPATK
jgi:hypothetical protein